MQMEAWVGNLCEMTLLSPLAGTHILTKRDLLLLNKVLPMLLLPFVQVPRTFTDT